MEIGERIKKRREELGMSQIELAEKVGYTSRSSIAKLETNANGMTQSKIIEFAKALKTTPSYLMGWEDSTENTQQNSYENIPGIRAVTVKTIPLFAEISCGEPIYASEDIKCYIPVGEDIEADFCVVANGDSMTGARIYDGDIVFIKKVDNINNGEIAAVWVDGDGALLKRIYIQDGVMSLVSENPKYAPRVYSGDRAQEVRLLGKAIAFQSSIE